MLSGSDPQGNPSLNFVEATTHYSQRVDLLESLQSVIELTKSHARREPEPPFRPYPLDLRLDPVTVASLVADYQDGWQTTDLTGRYGLSKASVLKLPRDEGVTMRRQGLSPEQTEQARRLYESGLSLAAVGDRLGFWPTSVSNALRKSGVELRPGRR